MRPVPLHPVRDRALAAELVALQRESYAVEAALIGSTAIPGLRDTPEAPAAADLTWSGVREGAGLLGAVVIEERPDGVGIDRLVVALHAFRRGVGAALVRHMLDAAGKRTVTVSTGRANAPPAPSTPGSGSSSRRVGGGAGAVAHAPSRPDARGAS